MKGREAGGTQPITRKEPKGPEWTRTNRKERRRKLVGYSDAYSIVVINSVTMCNAGCD